MSLQKLAISIFLGIGVLLGSLLFFELPLLKKVFIQNITHTVVLTENGFQPPTIAIHLNDFVEFKTEKNKDFWPASNDHPSHLLYSEFDPKHPIPKNKSWIFQFKKPGIHAYHDHLFPSATGVIRVIDDDGKLGNDDCADQKDTESCWNTILTSALENEGFEEGFRMFDELYKAHPAFAKDCHTYAHTLGKEAYKVFIENKKNIPNSPIMASCGYGFYHGFLEELAGKTNDPGEIREFCDSYKEKNKKNEKGQNYLQCYHGIGHGAVSKHEDLTGKKSQPIIDEALGVCRSVNTNELEMSYCSEGVFGPAYFIFKEESSQAKKMSQEYGVLSLCRVQKENLKTWCYHALSKFLLATNENSLAKSLELVAKIGDIKYEEISAYELFRVYARTNYDKNNVERLNTCSKAKSEYQKQCVNGVIDGFFLVGFSGKGVLRQDVCRGSNLTEELKTACKKRIQEQEALE